MSKKLSLTYRLLRRMGYNYSEKEYGQVTIFGVIKRFFHNIYVTQLGHLMNWAILEPFEPRKLRPYLMRKMGCHIGKDCFIGEYLHIDTGHSEMIYIGDKAHITGGCRLLCHQRDLTDYRVGDDASLLPYKVGEIHIGKGVMIGMETMIMPGVSIGDGAIVGAYSLVTKDIPAWTVAVGRPARVVRNIEERETDEHTDI